MLRTVGPQGSLFELLLPAGMRVLSGELAEVDAELDDGVFMAPFKAFFDPSAGRPSIPMETYVRLMFLKFRYSLGYEQLCVAVGDSSSWRRFCRIGLEAQVPHESTIRKITRRCGPDLIETLNDVLFLKACAAGKVNLDRVRVDTTVVEADIKYPTDSGLLTKAICRIAKLLGRLERSGVTVAFVDRTAAARAHTHSIGCGYVDGPTKRKPKSLLSLDCWPIWGCWRPTKPMSHWQPTLGNGDARSAVSSTSWRSLSNGLAE